MGFRDSMREMSGYMKSQQEDRVTRTKLVKDSIKSESKKRDYHNFKIALFEKLDDLFYEREYSRVVLRAKEDSLSHFKLLLKDEEFLMYYNGSFTISGEFEVSPRLFDL